MLAALGLTATGAAAVLALRGYLLNQVDDQLQQVSGPLVGRLDQAAQRGPVSIRSEPDGPPSAYYVRVTDSGAHAVYATTSLLPGQHPPQLPSWTVAQARQHQGAPFTVTSADDAQSWRVVAAPLPDAGLTVFVAVNIDGTTNIVHRLIAIDALVSVVVLVLLGALAYVLVRSSLRPLRDVERTAEAIAAGDLSLRVAEHEPRTEVGRLGASFNAMLARIERAFGAQAASEAQARSSEEQARASAEQARRSEEQMRQFVADASHELRTPLTSIRGFAELYRQGAVREPAEVARAMSRIEDEGTRMGVLVEDLLLLARLDQRRPLDRAPVDLRRLICDAAADAAAVAPGRQIRTEIDSPDPVVVTGDDARLRQVIGNLVGNALRYTPESSTITLRLGTNGSGARSATGSGRAVLEVTDDGPGMGAADAARAFERFYRADTARSRAQGGSGLGLSIVAGLTTAHGGSYDLRTAPGEGATFTITLPLASGNGTGEH